MHIPIHTDSKPFNLTKAGSPRCPPNRIWWRFSK